MIEELLDNYSMLPPKNDDKKMNQMEWICPILLLQILSIQILFLYWFIIFLAIYHWLKMRLQIIKFELSYTFKLDGYFFVKCLAENYHFCLLWLAINNNQFKSETKIFQVSCYFINLIFSAHFSSSDRQVFMPSSSWIRAFVIFLWKLPHIITSWT